MGWRSVYVRVLWVWLVSAHLFGFAQGQGSAAASSGVEAAGSAQTVEAALHQMSDRAAVIFIGTVENVRRVEGGGLGSGIVEIRFAVEQPLRGCAGATYLLREWGGFWTANDSRYRVGQRLLLLLHAPGAAGLSSPVGGMDGAIPVRASGAGVKSSVPDTAVSARQVADLRWIGRRVSRPISYRAPRTATQAATRSIHGAASASPNQEPASTALSRSSVSAQEASVASIVSMIRSWEAPSHVAR